MEDKTFFLTGTCLNIFVYISKDSFVIFPARELNKNSI